MPACNARDGAGTPASALVVAVAALARAIATPKSSTFTDPFGITWILAGFKSRWTIPPL